MNAQPDLFGGETPLDQPKLGVRQQAVLEYLARMAPEALEADEIGAMLCERSGRHSAGERCQWDGRDGRAVLKSLKAHGLVEKRGRTGWILSKTEPPAYDPATSEWPTGF